MKDSKDLKDFFNQYGTLVELPMNHRLLLHDDEAIFWVEEGDLDLFALEPIHQHVDYIQANFEDLSRKSISFLGDTIQGSLIFLQSIPAGTLLLGFNCQFKIAKPVIILIANRPSKIFKVSLSLVRESLLQDKLSHHLLDVHIQKWISSLSPIFLYRPLPAYLYPLERNATLQLKEGAFIPTESEEDDEKVVWLQIQEGNIQIAGLQTLTLKEEEERYCYPLALSTWLESSSKVTLSIQSVHPIISNDLCLKGLRVFHEHLINVIFFNKLLRAKRELNKINIQARADAQSLVQSFNQMGQIFSEEPSKFPLVGSNLIYRACQIIGNNLRLEFTPLPYESIRKFATNEEYIYNLCHYSHINYRKVTLMEDWWRHELGPLLCFNTEEKRPLALLPSPKGGYQVVYPETEESKIFDPEDFPYLQPEAYVFYRGFPKQSTISNKDFIRFSLEKKGMEWTKLAFFSALTVGILSASAFLSRQLFGVVIANLDYVVFIQVGFGLLLVSISTLIFSLAREYLSLRIQTSFDDSASSALWMRLLQLPANFFRKYNIGDLFSRTQFIPQVRRILSGAPLRAILTAVFSIFYLFPMFYYESKLSWATLGMLSVSMIILFIASWYMNKLSQEKLILGGTLTSKSLQSFLGINVIRTYGCENRF